MGFLVLFPHFFIIHCRQNLSFSIIISHFIKMTSPTETSRSDHIVESTLQFFKLPRPTSWAAPDLDYPRLPPRTWNPGRFLLNIIRHSMPCPYRNSRWHIGVFIPTRVGAPVRAGSAHMQCFPYNSSSRFVTERCGIPTVTWGVAMITPLSSSQCPSMCISTCGHWPEGPAARWLSYRPCS